MYVYASERKRDTNLDDSLQWLKSELYLRSQLLLLNLYVVVIFNSVQIIINLTSQFTSLDIKVGVFNKIPLFTLPARCRAPTSLFYWANSYTTTPEQLHVNRAKRGHLRASDSAHNGFTSSLSNSWPHNLMDIVYISVSIAVVPFIRSIADRSSSRRRACIAFDISQLQDANEILSSMLIRIC